MPNYAPYAWIIDKDFDFTEDPEYYSEVGVKSRVGVNGPRGIDPELLELLRSEDPAIKRRIKDRIMTFQLRSDDEGYADHKDYQGRLIFREGYDGTQFEPFDDFGPDCNSAAIFYRENRKWVEL